MKSLNSLVFHNLKNNSKKTIPTIISIILTSTLLISIGLAVSTWQKARIEDATHFNGDYHVMFLGLSSNQKDTLEHDQNINKIDLMQEVESIYTEDLTINIYTSLMDYQNYIDLATGRFPTNEKEIIISSNLAKRNNYKLNDYINTYKIVGIYNKNTIISNVDYASEIAFISGTNNNSYYAFIHYNNLHNIYDKIYDTADKLSLNYEVNKAGRNYENTYINASLLNAYGKYENKINELQIYSLISLILYILGLFCALAIYNSFTISLQERKKQISILRSIGASKKQIFKMLMLEVFLLTLISLPIAFFSSLGIVQSIIILINNSLHNLVNYKLSINIVFLLISILFILLTVFISSMVPALEISGSSLINSIKNVKIKSKKLKENYPLIRKCFGSEGEVAYKNIKRNRRKFITSITALTISLILFITLSSVINYFINATNSMKLANDIRINLPDKNQVVENEEVLNEIRAITKEEELVISKQAHFFNENKQMVQLVSLDPFNYNKYKRQIKVSNDEAIIYNVGNFLNENGEEITKEVIDSSKTKSLSICFIDYTTNELYPCYNNLNNLHFTTQNYLDVFNGLTYVVSIDTFNQVVDNYLSGYANNQNFKNNYSIVINSNRFRELDKEINDIINKYSHVDIYYENNALINYNNNHTLLIIKLILYIVIFLIAFTSILNIFNVLNTSMELRSSEFSILRSIGMSEKGLKKMIKLESLMLMGNTLIYGIPLSLGIVYLIKYILNIDVTNKIIFKFPTIYVIISIIGIILIILLIMTYSINKLKKKNIIETIREDGI